MLLLPESKAKPASKTNPAITKKTVYITDDDAPENFRKRLKRKKLRKRRKQLEREYKRKEREKTEGEKEESEKKQCKGIKRGKNSRGPICRNANTL